MKIKFVKDFRPKISKIGSLSFNLQNSPDYTIIVGNTGVFKDYYIALQLFLKFFFKKGTKSIRVIY